MARDIRKDGPIMQAGELKPCPFCGRPAHRQTYRHRDIYTGEQKELVRIGCGAAFSPRGDWGDSHDECPVAPMIDSLYYPGLDVAAAWNRRRDGEAGAEGGGNE